MATCLSSSFTQRRATRSQPTSRRLLQLLYTEIQRKKEFKSTNADTAAMHQYEFSHPLEKPDRRITSGNPPEFENLHVLSVLAKATRTVCCEQPRQGAGQSCALAECFWCVMVDKSERLYEEMIFSTRHLQRFLSPLLNIFRVWMQNPLTRF